MISVTAKAEILGDIASILSTQLGVQSSGSIDLETRFFADLGLEEMELGAVAADLDLYPEDAVAGIAERLRFGEAVERALDLALGS